MGKDGAFLIVISTVKQMLTIMIVNNLKHKFNFYLLNTKIHNGYFLWETHGAQCATAEPPMPDRAYSGAGQPGHLQGRLASKVCWIGWTFREARAPWISNQRSFSSPSLAMPRSTFLPPLECWGHWIATALNGMDAPTQYRHQCAKVEVFFMPLKREGASTMKVTTIGLDLAKNVFQVHGADARGATLLRKHPNVVCVALASRNARVAWAMLSRRQDYQGRETVKAPALPAALARSKPEPALPKPD